MHQWTRAGCAPHFDAANPLTMRDPNDWGFGVRIIGATLYSRLDRVFRGVCPGRL